MFKKLIAVSLIAICSAKAQDVLMSDFGTAQGVLLPGGVSGAFAFRNIGGITATDWSNGATFTSLVGTNANSGAVFITNNYTTPLNLTGKDRITLTARVDAGHSPLMTGFIVNAFTATNDFASAAFTVSSFGPSFTTVTSSAWTITGAFNPASVVRFSFAGGVAFGTDAWRMSFDSISASSAVVIPEPSTYASLAGVMILGFAVVRRRKASV